MPRAADLYLQGSLPSTHNPLDRLDFQPPKLPDLDLEAFIEQWTEFLETYLFPIIKNLTGIDLSSILDLLESINIPDLGDILGLLVRGVFPPWLLPPTHVGRLTNELPPLVADGSFTAIPLGIPGDAGTWFRDASKGKTALGAAAIEADGAYHDFIARPVAVAVGQKYQVGAWFASVAATGASGCVQLQVIEFGEGDDPLNTHVVASWNPTGTHDFTQLSGEYVVPAGVKMAAVSLAVTEGFTAGTVYFDDVTGPSTGLMQMSWVENLIQRWQQVAKLFGIVDTDLDGDVDLEDVWNTLWSVWLKPLNWIPTVAQDILDGIYNGFAHFGELIESSLPRSAALDTIYALLGLNLDSKTSISVLEAEVRLLKSEGNSLKEGFERVNANTLGSDWTDLHSSGGGAGGLGVRDGSALWIPSGAGNRTRIYRYNADQIDTDSFELSFVLANDPPQTFPDDAYGYACFRCSNSETSYGRLRIGRTSIVLQAVVTGTVYTLASAATDLRAGDTVTVRGGKTGDTSLHTYSVLRKGQALIPEFTDPNSRVKTGSGFRGMGLGGETSLRLPLLPPIPTQWVPAGFAAITMAEIL